MSAPQGPITALLPRPATISKEGTAAFPSAVRPTTAKCRTRKLDIHSNVQFVTTFIFQKEGSDFWPFPVSPVGAVSGSAVQTTWSVKTLLWESPTTTSASSPTSSSLLRSSASDPPPPTPETTSSSASRRETRKTISAPGSWMPTRVLCTCTGRLRVREIS